MRHNFKYRRYRFDAYQKAHEKRQIVYKHGEGLNLEKGVFDDYSSLFTYSIDVAKEGFSIF